ENLLLGMEALSGGLAKNRHIDPIVFDLFPILEKFLARKGGDLSGGQQQQLAIARAMLGRPSLLLLDEPFGALDQITRHRLHDEFGALHESEGFSALLVTHSIDEAVYLADRVLVMSSAPGRIVGEFAVPFPRPRSDHLRYSSEFAALVGNVARSLYRYAGDA
ncbi:MAG: ATP-binding cassette domain-containing protein, partial [Ilumatobacteraceae bacterium]